MARFTFQVFYDPPSGPDVQLDDVQFISITNGRKQIQDPFKAGTATITGRNPGNLPTINIGDTYYVNVIQGINGYSPFIGLVSNFRIDYGITPELDTWTIELEDGLAVAARAYTTSSFSWAAGIRTSQAAFEVCQNANIDFINIKTTLSYVSQGSSFVGARSFDRVNVLNILNQLAFTEQGRIVSLGADGIGWVNRMDLSKFNTFGSFTDGSLTATYNSIPFQNLGFRSLAESSFDSVIIQPEGLASQKAGSGDQTFVGQSYDQTTTQAQNLAEYVLATLEVNQAAPFTISVNSETQTNNNMMVLATQPTATAELIVRGNRFTVFINGFTLSATPDQCRITYDLVSSEAQNFFILDSSVFGVLDSSRLGF